MRIDSFEKQVVDVALPVTGVLVAVLKVNI